MADRDDPWANPTARVTLIGYSLRKACLDAA
jgi:hypothetical protein